MKRLVLLCVLSAMIGVERKAHAIEMFTHYGNGDYNHDRSLGTPWMQYREYCVPCRDGYKGPYCAPPRCLYPPHGTWGWF